MSFSPRSTAGIAADGVKPSMSLPTRVLDEIGYLVPERPVTATTTEGVDAEIAEVAGPQLIVPVMNARYALERGECSLELVTTRSMATDDLADPPRIGRYEPERGARVISWVRDFLAAVTPLKIGSHAEVVRSTVVDGLLEVNLADGATPGRWIRGCWPAIGAMLSRRNRPFFVITGCKSSS